MSATRILVPFRASSKPLHSLRVLYVPLCDVDRCLRGLAGLTTRSR